MFLGPVMDVSQHTTTECVKFRHCTNTRPTSTTQYNNASLILKKGIRTDKHELIASLNPRTRLMHLPLTAAKLTTQEFFNWSEHHTLLPAKTPHTSHSK